MLRRLTQLFSRYADRHVTFSLPSYAIIDANDGQKIGFVDRISASGGRLVVEGWLDADRVAIVHYGLRAEAEVNLPRVDVVVARPELTNQTPGFAVSLPYHSGAFGFEYERQGQVFRQPLRLSTKGRISLRRAMAVPGFIGRLIGLLPTFGAYKLTSDPLRKLALRAEVKARLGLFDDPVGSEAVLDETVFDRAADGHDKSAAITIVLPVYNAFEMVQECIACVEKHTDVPWHLVVIEDCSTDAAVRPWLQQRAREMNAAQPNRVTLIENARNLGFIGSVNRGFEAALKRRDHVVLLNSDAFVPMGWASRLIQPILRDKEVASVTPMSNDAEIFGAPMICAPIALNRGEGFAMDRAAAKLSPVASLAQAPTGVGFCMAMNIAYLQKIPQLDHAFGRGYGEEVDWCQKAAWQGGRNLGLGTVFVEHRGGQSFGSVEKAERVAASGKIISGRYPGFDREVQDFIATDPLATPRLALAVAWAGAQAQTAEQPLPVYVAHSMGGGAEKYLEQRIADDLCDGAGAAIVLRVGGRSRWSVEVHHPAGVTTGRTDKFDMVKQLLAPVEQMRLIYSNAVGDRDPVTLPEMFLSLIEGGDHLLDVLIHDFFVISPSFTLLNENGVFEGVPDEATTLSVHSNCRQDGSAVTLLDWRDAWRPLMERADRIVTFSSDGADHIRVAYPDTAPLVMPHTGFPLPASLPQADQQGRSIGILGNLGMAKGAAVVQALAAYVADQPDQPPLVLLGQIDPSLLPPKGLRVHGQYDLDDIAALVRTYDIGTWLIPSVCPETFSYTTHECIATGLPVWCFDLGAQGQAVKAALAQGKPGGIVPLELQHDPAATYAMIRST